VLLGFLVVTALAIARMRDLIGVTMLASIYSLLSASIFMVLDAVDVALAEAAVGAGVTTVLMLGTLSLTTSRETRPRHTPLLPLIAVTATGAALLYGTLDMPRYGDPDAPIHQHVAPRYIQSSVDEIGVPNIVTSILASYRGYDTLGELTVIFTAGTGVLALLWGRREPKPGTAHYAMRAYPVLRVIAKLFIPLILLFALYIEFHGDYGPGGGFQAGVIFATAFILYAMVFSLGAAQQVLTPAMLRILAAAGVLIFAGVGFDSLLLGGNFLDYNVLSDEPRQGQHRGIMLVESGVGLTVAAVMINIYYAFAGRRP
jgi:multicomponent Na+:H+ antiporter subunit B